MKIQRFSPGGKPPQLRISTGMPISAKMFKMQIDGGISAEARSPEGRRSALYSSARGPVSDSGTLGPERPWHQYFFAKEGICNYVET
jgi:hypothetical protein